MHLRFFAYKIRAREKMRKGEEERPRLAGFTLFGDIDDRNAEGGPGNTVHAGNEGSASSSEPGLSSISN